MNKTIVLIVLLLLVTAGAYAQRNAGIFLNPGFKVGYSFDDEGEEITYGFELSLTRYYGLEFTRSTDIHTGEFFGGVLTYDYCPARDRHKFRIGAEGGIGIIGLELGASWIDEPGFSGAAFTCTPFAGGLFYFYTSRTLYNDKELIEAGGFAKIPITLQRLD